MFMEPETRTDGDLSLPQYWKRHQDAIANLRKWGCLREASQKKPSAERRILTIQQYDRAMEILSQFLPNKPMASLTAFELLQAVQKSKVVNGKVYSDSTLEGRLSLLRDIYDFAQDRGDACNDLQYINKKQLTHFLRAVNLSSKERKAIVKQLSEETRSKKRSLTAAQQAKLVAIFLDHIEEDGRYLMLAILLCTGMRPSECRGLNWFDWVSFTDHPERHMLPVDRQRGDHNELVDRLKRPGSYRKIGVHIELEEIINRRLTFTLKHFSSFQEIASYPMCSYKNEFAHGCSRTQLSTFAVKVLEDSIRVSNEVMETCIWDMYAYENDLLPKNEDDAEDLRVCTYLLRHDFWTWMQASTELSEDEKRYLFGHAIYDGMVDKRPMFNYENWLWDMLLKLDHTVKYLPLHEIKFRGILGPDSSLSAPNVGQFTLRLSPELLRTGGQVTIMMQANEYDDPISMKTLTPTKTIFQGEQCLQLQALLLPHTREDTYRHRINTDYDNRMARRPYHKN